MNKRLTSCLLALTAVTLLAPAAWATIGAGSLIVMGANSTPTHWDIPVGVATTATICGVSTSEVGDPLPATLTVWVKSSEFGNTMLIAMRVDMTDCYEFIYFPPFSACNTTVVAYQTLGLEANNDIADDGMDNGSGTAASGFRFIDALGNPIECPVGAQQSSWGTVKAQYR